MIINSDTPRTDENSWHWNVGNMTEVVYSDFARTLERELNQERERWKSNPGTAVTVAIERIQTQRDKWKACAKELADCLYDLLHHGCSIQHPMTGEQIQHQSNPEAALEAVSRFDKLASQP